MRSLWERFEPLRDRAAEAWAIWSILAAQATLTLPWMWRTAAYKDEQSYLAAGHLGWSQLWAGATSFPGVPVIYPRIAATFYSAGRLVAGPTGGLFAARLPSLAFMLAATAMVYLIGDRMFGRMPGILAALLFAVCGIVVHLGAAATFDPMALFLLVLALYAAVRMRDGATYWVVVCPLALAAANATKYPTAAFDPVIFGTTIFYGWSKGRIQAILLTMSVAVTTAVVDFGILMLGGENLAMSVRSNLLESSLSGVQTSWLDVLGHAALMTGLIVLIALAGVWASLVKRMPATASAFLCLLVLAAFVAPIEQAHAHELTSLDENMGFGLPFAALAAGYALGAWRQWLGWQRHWGKVIATTAAVITVITMLIVGRLERVQFRGPNVQLVGAVSQVVGSKWVSGTYVLEDSPTASADQIYLPKIPTLEWLKLYTPSLDKYQQGLINRGCVSVVVIAAPLSNVVTSAGFRSLVVGERPRGVSAVVIAANNQVPDLSNVLTSAGFSSLAVGESPHEITIWHAAVPPPQGIACE